MRRNKREGTLSRFVENKTTTVLILLFLVSTCVRFLLSYLTSTNPTVYIDEGLYINIARSLFHDGQVMFRDQPIQYVYLLYSIVLMPVFLLPKTIDIYRVIQLYNAALISSCVFPSYLVGRKLGVGKKHASFVAFVTLLIPELCLSTFLTAECIVYPLMMWSFVAAIEVSYHVDRIDRYLILGALTGIIYFAKPICIVFGLCYLVSHLAYAISEKNKAALINSLIGIIMSLAIIGTGYILYGLLFGKTSVMNLYEKQIPELDAESIFIMVQGFVFHLIAVVISCGGAFTLVPVLARKQCSREKRNVLEGCLFGLLVSLIGIAIFIVPYRFTGSVGVSPVHLRYLMFYFPVFFAFFFVNEMERLRMPSKTGILAMIIFTVLFVWPSAFSMFNYQAGTFDAPALNAFYANRSGKAHGYLLIMVLVPVMAYFIYVFAKKGWNNTLRKMACGITIFFFVYNGTLAYTNRRMAEREIEWDAAQVSTEIVGENAVIITNNLYDDFRGYLLDAHLHEPAQMVVINNALLSMISSEGRYQPFTPLVQAPNTSNNETKETNTLVFDVSVADFVEFTEDVDLWQTDHGYYTVARFDDNKPVIKTALASLDAYVLHKEDIASLLVFDGNMLSRGYATLRIVVRSRNSETGTITFSSEGETQTFAVTPEYQEYVVTLPMHKNEFFGFEINATVDTIVGDYETL